MAKREAPLAPIGIAEHHPPCPWSPLYLQGDPASVRHAWLGCHGYGQLAGGFIGDLSIAAGTTRLLIAPVSSYRHAMMMVWGVVARIRIPRPPPPPSPPPHSH